MGVMARSSGQLPRDGDANPIQVANRLVFQDATATPVVSPKTSISTAGSGQAFVPPAGAVNMIFRASAACRYGDNSYLDAAGAGKGYMTAAADTDTVIPCVNGSTIYICAASGTITVTFCFEVLN